MDAAEQNIVFAKLRRGMRQLPYVPQALALAWRATKSCTLAWSALLLAQGLLPVAIVHLTRLLVDALVVARGSGGSAGNVRNVLVLVALLALVLLVGELLRALTDWVQAAQSERVRNHVADLIHRQSVTLDLSFYELPDFYDHLYRARDQAMYQPMFLLESTGSILQNAITLVAMMGVLLTFGIWIPIALMLSSVPAFFVLLRHILREHRWRIQSTPLERRGWYYDSVLTGGDTAAELRLFGLGEHFRSAYRAIRHCLGEQRLRMAREQATHEFAAAAVALAVTGGAVGWMAWRTVQGALSLGQLTLFYQAFSSGLRLVRVVLQNVTKMYSSSLFVGSLLEFLQLKPRVADPLVPTAVPAVLARDITFRGVTFRYPGSERLALDGFDLTIPAGKIVAIVGPNGAGKTSLIKLVCRLYDPEAGRVEIDGVDIRLFRLEELRGLFTVLFQHPVRYNATVSENVKFGDLSAKSEDGNNEQVRIAAVAASADEVIQHLPHRYQTILGKSFEEGTDLSGGEWQRIGLARAFFRHSPVILLDEPTSAMDPWAEVDWLRRLRHVAAGRTVVLITHRFTTAMHADVVHAMSKGRIIESGTHDELIGLNGLYARSWNAQVGTVAADALPGAAR